MGRVKVRRVRDPAYNDGRKPWPQPNHETDLARMGG
jgi:hypothetical protein